VSWFADFFVLAPIRALAGVGALTWLVLLALAKVVWRHVQGTRLVGLQIVLVTVWLHLVFARTGWLGRYEAWLIAMLVMALAPFAQEMLDGGLRRRWPVRVVGLVVITFFVLFPVRLRVASSLFQANRGSTNIYEQQIQMARFIAANHTGDVVALNDVGAVNYLADFTCVDLWGLTDPYIARRRMAGELDPQELGWIVSVRGAKIAVAYETMLAETGGAPPEWEAVAEWRIHRNAVCDSNKVTWFATSAEEAPALREELLAWADELPDTVEVRWR
jgi:hypothetical protein